MSLALGSSHQLEEFVTANNSVLRKAIEGRILKTDRDQVGRQISQFHGILDQAMRDESAFVGLADRVDTVAQKAFDRLLPSTKQAFSLFAEIKESHFITIYDPSNLSGLNKWMKKIIFNICRFFGSRFGSNIYVELPEKPRVIASAKATLPPFITGGMSFGPLPPKGPQEYPSSQPPIEKEGLSSTIVLQYNAPRKLTASELSSLKIHAETGKSELKEYSDSLFSWIDVGDGKYMVTRVKLPPLEFDQPIMLTDDQIGALRIRKNGLSDLQQYSNSAFVVNKCEGGYFVTRTKRKMLEFNIPTPLTTDQTIALKIRHNGLSDLKEYEDSAFQCEPMGNGYVVIRKNRILE